jgi:type I restriction enzyme S subunit
VKLSCRETDIGLIPVGWEIATIGDLCHIFGRIGFRGYTVKDIVDEGNGAIAINPSNIQDGKTLFENCTYISWYKYEESPEIKIFDGDVILVKTGSTFGKTAMVKNLPSKATLNPQMLVFKKIKPNPVFFSYILGFKTIQDQINIAVAGGALPTLSQRLIAKFKLSLPSTQSEQLAIAQSLSDVDSLLKTLDKIIIKRRHIKQAVIQQLLTGKIRLPGFGGEWVEKTLGSMCGNLTTGKLDANAMSPDGSYRFYTCAKDFYYINNYAFDCEALLISGNGAHVGYIHYYKGKFNAYQRTYVLSNFSAEIKYLQYYLSEKFSERVLLEVKAGGTPYITRNTIVDMLVKLPSSIDEQKAIAKILSDIDEELLKLEERHNKTKQLKQAMMQELLTGKTRLVKPEATHA